MAIGWKNQYFRYKDFFLNIGLLYKRREDVRMFLEIILSLGTVAIFAIFALKPTALTIAQLAKDIKAKEETLAQLTAKTDNLSTAKKLYEAEVSSIPAIKYAIPDIPTSDSLVRQIEMAAAKDTIKILNFAVDGHTLIGTPKAALTPEGLSAFPTDSGSVTFAVTVTGDYPALLAFLKDLENLRRPIKIDLAKVFSVALEVGLVQNMTVGGRAPYLLIAK